MFDNNIFAERLYLLRTQANINQKSLAEAIGVSYHTISKIENKQRAASIDVIYAISEYFNVSLDYLLGKSDKRIEQTDNSNQGIDSTLIATTTKEKDLLEYFRTLNYLEQNVILGKISEFIYNKQVEESYSEPTNTIPSSESIRLNK